MDWILINASSMTILTRLSKVWPVEVTIFMGNAPLAYTVTEGGPNVRYGGLVTDAGGAVDIFVQTTDGRRTPSKKRSGRGYLY